MTGGRRTALPRHQTLRATLDWSYELLSEPERVMLRRLAVFAGVFRLEAASAVIASPEIAPAEVVDGIADLVAKSLVTGVAGSAGRAIGCSTRCGPMGSKNSPKAARRNGSRAVTPEYYRDPLLTS